MMNTNFVDDRINGKMRELNKEWWSDTTPSIIDRLSALAKTINPNSDHELSSAIAARPWSAAQSSEEIVHLDIYKVWFVLHRAPIDEDNRITNLYIKQIGKTTTTLDRLTSVDIQASLLPLKNDFWAEKMEGFNNNDQSTNGLYEKYEVYKDGKEVNNCFVVEPKSDEDAREAIRAYAASTDNNELSHDLVEWMEQLENNTE